LTDTLTTERTIHPARNLLGTLRLPGDKSISHRYALLAALAEGGSRFQNFSTGADCASSLACVRQLGAKVTHSGDTVEVQGSAGRLTPPGTVLDCGNSGSTMRMLTGLLAPQGGAFTLEGDASLNRRPMERVRKPLLEMGASIDLLDGHAPVRIQGAKLRGISYTTPVPSAQVKTALLFAGLQAEGTTTVNEAVRTRDHGELALRAFGAEIRRSSDSVSITGGQKLRGMEATVPGDTS
jgi:3-phosphoshikimate 1-carboxyvinyltransferase